MVGNGEKCWNTGGLKREDRVKKGKKGKNGGKGIKSESTECMSRGMDHMHWMFSKVPDVAI